MNVKWYTGVSIRGGSPHFIILDEYGDKPMKTWLNVFLRINNRKRRHTYLDLMVAGYPMVVLDRMNCWKELHRACKEIFVDGRGRQTYIWFGERFFFLTKEDAEVFRGLIYAVPPDRASA